MRFSSRNRRLKFERFWQPLRAATSVTGGMPGVGIGEIPDAPRNPVLFDRRAV
ncbi:hypothetical protein [Streptomyces sp. NPDC055709]